MSLLDTWRVLSARIHGLNEAAKLDAMLRPNAQTTTGSTAFLQAQAIEIFGELENFRLAHEQHLPTSALAVLHKALELGGANPPTHGANRGIAGNHLVHLQAIESALSYSLSGSEQRVYSLAERALQHLQRSLLVDDSLRARWLTTFEKREPDLESLGAVHLLSHGIFAFKIDAQGARTDLVIPDNDPADASRYATGIVLTEWKKAKTADEANRKVAEAHRQAQLYVSGPLASIELRNTRYAIIVTKSRMQLPPDEEKQGITYRNVNISLEYITPSQISRQAPRK